MTTVLDDGLIRKLGLKLNQSQDLVQLRLPSRLGCASWALLGFVGLMIFVIWMDLFSIALDSGERAILYITGSSLVALAVLWLLYLAARRMRHGEKVSVTPQRLIVKRHWTVGGESLELPLSQVLFRETRRGIVIMGGGKTVRIGSGLKPGARHSIVEFLNGVIAEQFQRVHQSDNSTPEGASEAVDVEVPRARHDLAGARIAPEETGQSEPVNLVALALCLRARNFDVGQVHLAPTIGEGVLVKAFQGYLDLQDDEVLLAILGTGSQGSVYDGCALTTKRVYWPGEAAAPAGPSPRRSQSLVYSSLPETVTVAGFPSSGVDVGQPPRIRVGGIRPLQTGLAAFLRDIRPVARGEASSPDLGEQELAAARWAWPLVVSASDAARKLQSEIHTYVRHAHVVTKVVVTPSIFLACIGVFVAMVVGGASITQPDNQMMFEWGANFGPSVVFDHQAWRLFTSMFLHFGIIHLLANLFCLITAGPVLERFLGHLGFAALYVLSGLGGSIASLWVHPNLICAGASGAIFGVFGGLLAYLALRHREVPAAVLKPMRSGALAFLAYNLIFGLGVPGIDMAAHVGGMCTGFVCGLLLTLATRRSTRPAGQTASILPRLGVIAVLSAIVAAAGWKGMDLAGNRLLADPQMGPLLTGQRDAITAWNAFNAALEPLLKDFERVGTRIDQLMDDLRRGGVPVGRATETLDRLKAESQTLDAAIQGLPAENAEIQTIRDHLSAAQSAQLQLLTSLETFVTTGNEARLEGPKGVAETTDRFLKAFGAFNAAVEAYFKTHGLERVPRPR
jgi:rhomboid protease GluP